MIHEQKLVNDPRIGKLVMVKDDGEVGVIDSIFRYSDGTEYVYLAVNPRMGHGGLTFDDVEFLDSFQIINTGGPVSKLRALKRALKEKYPYGFLCEATAELDAYGFVMHNKLKLTLPGAFSEDMHQFLDSLSDADIIYLFEGFDAITRATTAWRFPYGRDAEPREALSKVVTENDVRIGEPVRKTEKPWFTGKIVAIQVYRGAEHYVIMNDQGIGYVDMTNKDVMVVTKGVKQ